MRKTITVPLRWQSSVRWRIGGGGGTGVLVVPPALVQLQLPRQARRAISNCAVRYTDKDNNGSKNGNAAATTTAERAMAQSQSPLGRVGVAAALAAAAAAPAGMDGKPKPKPTVWEEFALRDRVALVSGANRGLGLEMALVLVEAGARAVYCVDLPARAGDEWRAVAEYVGRMEWPVVEGGGTRGRLEYVCADVRDQKAMWRVGEEIGDREGRMDVCVAAAGILKAHRDCLEYPGEEFEEVRCFFFFLSFFLWKGGEGYLRDGYGREGFLDFDRCAFVFR